LLVQAAFPSKALLFCKASVTFIYIVLQLGLQMYTTTDERGILNNYATEPAVYLAEAPSSELKRRYIFQGAAATLLVALTLLTAFAVS